MAFCLAIAVKTGGLNAAAITSLTPLSTNELNNNNWSLGWEFRVGSSAISVNRLGFYDQGLNGLADSHAVGIFTTTGSLLVLRDRCQWPRRLRSRVDSGIRRWHRQSWMPIRATSFQERQAVRIYTPSVPRPSPLIPRSPTFATNLH